MNVSSYDDVSEQAVFLSRVSSLLAQAIYQFTNADSTALLKANASTVHHVMYCLLTNPQCDLFFQVLSPSNIPGLKQANRPFPFYVGVFISEKSPSNDIQRLTKHMLAYFSGSPLENVDNSSCINMGGVWMNGPLVNGSRQNVCYSNRTQYHVALSPAFDITGYNFSSGQYSTWTESVWDRKAFHIKLFLRPSLEVELACMVAGISLFIASAIFIVYIHRRADVLFPAIIPSLDSTEPLKLELSPPICGLTLDCTDTVDSLLSLTDALHFSALHWPSLMQWLYLLLFPLTIYYLFPCLFSVYCREAGGRDQLSLLTTDWWDLSLPSYIDILPVSGLRQPILRLYRS